MMNRRAHNRRWHLTPWGWQYIRPASFARILAARWRKHKRGVY